MPKRSLDWLHPDFRHAVEWLEFRIRREGLHLKRFETFRSMERQGRLYARGTTKAKPGQSPHNHGLAADYILNTERVRVNSREWPRGSGKMYPDAWDRTTPEAIDHWTRFGELALSIGLVWGGGWRPDENGLGWDLPHVEMPDWRSYIDTSGPRF